MKVLVTGSSGFFASWLIPALVEAGHKVVPCDVKTGQDLANKAQMVDLLRGCDAVIHLAAYPHFKPEIPAQEFTRLNIIGTARLVAAMKEAGVKRLVYTSSGAIYGFGPNRSYDGWVRPPIREDMPVTDWGMVDAYGASKLACEQWLSMLVGKNLTVTSLRINCIEPHHGGAKDVGAHWGWWCSQRLASRAYIAALNRFGGGFLAVNVGEENPNLDLSNLHNLLSE